jgi:hypothetical protein
MGADRLATAERLPTPGPTDRGALAGVRADWIAFVGSRARLLRDQWARCAVREDCFAELALGLTRRGVVTNEDALEAAVRAGPTPENIYNVALSVITRYAPYGHGEAELALQSVLGISLDDAARVRALAVTGLY